MDRVTREGPGPNEVQIIGVELAVTVPGKGEIELDTFACRHTLTREPYAWRDIRITLHTSNGDITIRQPTNQL